MYLEISLYTMTRHMIESGNTGVRHRIGVMSWAGISVDRVTSRAFGTAGEYWLGVPTPALTSMPLFRCHKCAVLCKKNTIFY